MTVLWAKNRISRPEASAAANSRWWAAAPLRALGEQGAAPAGQKAVDGSGVQCLNGRMSEAGRDGPVPVGDRSAGDDQRAVRPRQGQALDAPDGTLTLAPVGHLVQAVEQDQCLAGIEQTAKIVRV